jgi:hypothetical protein
MGNLLKVLTNKEDSSISKIDFYVDFESKYM